MKKENLEKIAHYYYFQNVWMTLLNWIAKKAVLDILWHIQDHQIVLKFVYNNFFHPPPYNNFSKIILSICLRTHIFYA